MKLLLKTIEILVVLSFYCIEVSSLNNGEMTENWVNSTELEEQFIETDDYFPFKQELFKTKYIIVIHCGCGASGQVPAVSPLPTIPTAVQTLATSPSPNGGTAPTGGTAGTAAMLLLRKTKKPKKHRKKQRKNLNRNRSRRTRMSLFLHRQNRLQYLMGRYRRPTLFNVPFMPSILGK